MSDDITWMDGPRIELVERMGSDARIVEAARVSTRGEASRGQAADHGLIRFLWRNGHVSPFEHAAATFMLTVPLFVQGQLVRHKSMSFNIESARYREVEPRFYLPPADRPLQQVGKPGAYTMQAGTGQQQRSVREALAGSAQAGWRAYRGLLSEGAPRELARAVLPQHWMSSIYMTGNLRSWLHFLAQRDSDHAQYEIRQVARIVRAELGRLFPVVMSVAGEEVSAA